MKRERERESQREKEREIPWGSTRAGRLKAEAEAVTITDDPSLMRGDDVLWTATGPIFDKGKRCALDWSSMKGDDVHWTVIGPISDEGRRCSVLACRGLDVGLAVCCFALLQFFFFFFNLRVFQILIEGVPNFFKGKQIKKNLIITYSFFSKLGCSWEHSGA